MVLLAVVTGVLLPLVALATIVLLPFTNRGTQALVLGVYVSYLVTILAFGSVIF